jgi:hypothetical protein
MTHAETLELLAQQGFENGWAVADGVLVLWEHDTDPPAPLVRPSEATNEATVPDADTGASAD